MVLAHSGFLILVSIVLRNRTITNIFSVLIWFAYSFIPIGRDKLFGKIVNTFAWGSSPNLIYCLTMLSTIIITWYISYNIFKRQEVVT